MNISTIEQGEELLKASTPGPWVPNEYTVHQSNDERDVIFSRGLGEGHTISEYDERLVLFLVNHASELLQMARELQMLKDQYPLYEAPALSVEDYKRYT